MICPKIEELETKVMELQANVASLLWLTRDGIELAWSSWYEWQGVARRVLREEHPAAFLELDHLTSVLKIARKHKILPDELREAVIKKWGAA